MFNSLHTMFMDQYTEQWTALDETAERSRALGFNAPGSYAEFIKLTTIKEEPGLTEAPDWREMVHQLVVGNEAVCRTSRKVLKTADDASDDTSVDLLTKRLQTHEKNAWRSEEHTSALKSLMSISYAVLCLKKKKHNY